MYKLFLSLILSIYILTLKANGQELQTIPSIQEIKNIIHKSYDGPHNLILKNIKDKKILELEDYPEELIELYHHLFKACASIILKYKDLKTNLKDVQESYQLMRTILIELEFKEEQIENINNKVVNHLKSLKDIQYSLTFHWSLSYLSWQHDSNVKKISTNDKANLIVTNQGICAGGDIGIRNAFYHFALEGCFFSGQGDVTAYGNNNISYQKNSNAFGLKMGPTIYKMILTSKNQIGIGIPVIFTNQKIPRGDDTDLSFEKIKKISFLPTIKARWYVNEWYVTSEFGQYIGKNNNIWGLGFGRAF